jgi:uncharacterized repeat protein (TIGR02543 family)
MSTEVYYQTNGSSLTGASTTNYNTAYIWSSTNVVLYVSSYIPNYEYTFTVDYFNDGNWLTALRQTTNGTATSMTVAVLGPNLSYNNGQYGKDGTYFNGRYIGHSYVNINMPSINLRSYSLTGYNNLQWERKERVIKTYNFGELFTPDYLAVNFHLKKTVKTYSISYNKDGGTTTGTDTTSATYNQNFTLPSSISKTGFNFNGWYINSNFTGAKYLSGATFLWNIDADTTFYAQFTGKPYTVSYNKDGGTTTGTDPTSATYNQNFTLPSISKTGFDFDGWYINANFTGTKYLLTAFSWNIDANTTFYVKFKPKTYTVAYNKDGGITTGTDPTSATYNENFTLPSISKTGFNFDGWYINSNFTGTKYLLTAFSWNIDANTTFYAQFTGKPYTVSYNKNGGTTTGTDPTSATYNQNFTLPSISKTNYTFIGWYINADFTGVKYLLTAFSWNIDANTTFYAKFDLNAVNIIWNTGGKGNNRTDENVIIGSTVTAPTPKSIGYTFNGWYNTVTEGTLQVNGNSSYTIPSSATTLYARWTDNGNINFLNLKSTYNLTDPIKISTIFGLVGFSTTEPRKLSADFKGKGPNI